MSSAAIIKTQTAASSTWTPLTVGRTDVQTLTKSGTVSGGTFALTYTSPRGIAGTLATVPYNVSAAQLQILLRTLPELNGFGPVSVACTLGPLPNTGIVCTFTSQIGLQVAMTVDNTNITGGGTIVNTHTTSGVPNLPNKFGILISNGPDGGTDSAVNLLVAFDLLVPGSPATPLYGSFPLKPGFALTVDPASAPDTNHIWIKSADDSTQVYANAMVSGAR